MKNDLSKISKDLMLKEPYYGFFLIMLNKVWSNRLPTAGVSKNGINYQLAINSEFWDSLSTLHKLGLLKHELLHIAFGHLTTFTLFKDKRLANVAMDMEINQYIDEDWLPEGGINIEDYQELNLDYRAGCRYYYDKLKQFKEQKKEKGSSGCDNMDKLLDNIENGDIPDHSTWEEFEDLPEAEKKLIEKQIQRVLSEAKEQTVKKCGHIPGEIEDVIKIEEITPPKFDWRGYLRRFTGTSTKVFTKKTRRKENIRFSGNPGLKIKMKQRLLLAIDTSGSVSNDELREFMSEIHHIYKTGTDITVIQCDTRIKSIEEYKGNKELEVQGRGGTEFDPVLEYFNENIKTYTSMIYFTDGEAYSSVKPKGKVLWVLSEQSSMNEELPGKVIKLEL
jgi:predicted metal-dependent peptidase